MADVGQLSLELLDHEYGGEIIRQRTSDGYINATAMCRAAGREWPMYRRLKSTEAFLDALALDLQILKVQLCLSNLGSPDGDRKNEVAFPPTTLYASLA